MKSAIRYNKKFALPAPSITSASTDSIEYAEDVLAFQKEKGLTEDGKMGPTTLAHVRQAVFEKCCSQSLSQKDYKKIVAIVSKFEGKYWSTNRDGEYRGLFDRPGKPHWASGKVHIGLSFGFIQFTQDGGQLGQLLTLMHGKDSGLFREIFGDHSDELLEVTNRKGRTRVAGRSPRVQTVGGHDLWDNYWIKRFRKAGRNKAFQDSQLELAVKNFMKPAIRNCEELGFSSERALALVFDRSVQYGPTGALRLIKRAGGADKDEHLRLRHLLQTWKGRRWHHRVQKIYMNPTLRDSTFAFE